MSVTDVERLEHDLRAAGREFTYPATPQLAARRHRATESAFGLAPVIRTMGVGTHRGSGVGLGLDARPTCSRRHPRLHPDRRCPHLPRPLCAARAGPCPNQHCGVPKPAHRHTAIPGATYRDPRLADHSIDPGSRRRNNADRRRNEGGLPHPAANVSLRLGQAG